MKQQLTDAIRFSAQIDAMLQTKNQVQDRNPHNRASEMLMLAEQLSAIGSPEAEKLRMQLRSRVIRDMETREVTRRRTWWMIPLPNPLPGRALGVMALFLTLLFLGFTPIGRSVARAVEQFVSELRWPNSVVRQVEPADRPENPEELREWHERELAAGRAWHFSFEGHNFGGCCAYGMRNEIVSLSQAIREVGQGLQLPTVLPDGYTLEGIRLLGLPPYTVFVSYTGPNGRLGVYQTTLGTISVERPSLDAVVVDARASAVVTDGTIEEVMIGEISAGLVEGEALVWEEGGRSFQLIGPGLDIEILLQIAESLQPST
jgi:hypothetical protein